MADPHSCHRYLRHNIVVLVRGQLLTADLEKAEAQIVHTVVHILKDDMIFTQWIADNKLLVKNADRPPTADATRQVMAWVFVAIDPLAPVPRMCIGGHS